MMINVEEFNTHKKKKKPVYLFRELSFVVGDDEEYNIDLSIF